MWPVRDEGGQNYRGRHNYEEDVKAYVGVYTNKAQLHTLSVQFGQSVVRLQYGSQSIVKYATFNRDENVYFS